MTQFEQNALTKQIKGLTWGIVLTIVSTVGGTLYLGLKWYTNLMTAITINATKNEEIDRRLGNMDTRFDGLERRLNSQDQNILSISQEVKKK